MSYEDRFFQKIEKTKTCWFWKGALNSKGYGSFAVERKSKLAHRYSYELHKGEIPKGMLICHSCDIPKCVNPDHLWAGTASDNAKDMFNKNRNGYTNRKRTHCRNGHLFTEKTTYINERKDGRIDKICRICKNERDKQRRKKNKGV